MSEELKPCPFCGEPASSGFAKYCDCHGMKSGEVSCDSCGAKIDHRDSEAEAIADWNRRTEHSTNTQTHLQNPP